MRIQLKSELGQRNYLSVALRGGTSHRQKTAGWIDGWNIKEGKKRSFKMEEPSAADPKGRTRCHGSGVA